MRGMGKAKKLGGLHEVIADNVRRLRKGKGLSQEALAEECGYHRTPQPRRFPPAMCTAPARIFMGPAGLPPGIYPAHVRQ